MLIIKEYLLVSEDCWSRDTECSQLASFVTSMSKIEKTMEKQSFIMPGMTTKSTKLQFNTKYYIIKGIILFCIVLCFALVDILIAVTVNVIPRAIEVDLESPEVSINLGMELNAPFHFSDISVSSE